MKLPSHIFGSDFYSISEVTRILLLNFVIFCAPCCLDCFPFENFSHLQVRFLTIFSLLFCRSRSGLGSSFLPENFPGCKIFPGPLFFYPGLPSASNPPFLVPTINFVIFFIQPFNRHLRPLIGLSFAPPSPPPFFSFSGFSMVKTSGGSAFRTRVRRSSPPPASGSSVATPAAAAPATALLIAAMLPTAPSTATMAAPTAAQGYAIVVSSVAAPAPRRYHTRVGPTPPSPSHPRPSRRASLSKRARTSGPGESSSSRPQEPQSPPYQGPIGAPPLDLSPASIIRRPLFHYNLILGNVDCNERDLHNEVYYNFPSFSADPELRDSMLLVQRYSLEPFMTPRLFFYPRVVIEFYHTMTSKREPHPTALHFSIDGQPGILKALDIAATFNLSVVLANPAKYMQWPHPYPKEIVRLLSGDITVESVLFRRQLPSHMLLIDHIQRSNLFPLQHTVQRRGSILKALFCISEGY